MKKGRPNIKGSSNNLSGLIRGEYRSSYTRLNQKDIIFNFENLFKLTKRYEMFESIAIDISNETKEFLNNALKEYLKNVIQKLIESNRRRTYSKYFSFSKQNKIISYGINVQRDPNPSINAKKNKFYPQKNLDLICTINVDKKLDLLNQHNALVKKRKYNKDEEEEDKIINDEKNDEKEDGKPGEGSDSDEEYDFFQKDKKKRSKEINNNNNNKEYLGIMNVYQSHELTTNKKMNFKKFNKGRIELKDLVNYLEDNQAIPLNKELLYKAYTEMTISGNK
jgi:hypothetical protein